MRRNSEPNAAWGIALAAFIALAIWGIILVGTAGMKAFQSGSPFHPVILFFLVLAGAALLLGPALFCGGFGRTDVRGAAINGAVMLAVSFVWACYLQPVGGVLLFLGLGGAVFLPWWATVGHTMLAEATGQGRPAGRVTPGVAKIYSGKSCGACGGPFEIGAPTIECRDCRRWYHMECWAERGGCVATDCPGARSVYSKPSAPPPAEAPLPPVPVAAPPPTPQAGQPISTADLCPYCYQVVEAGSNSVRCPQCNTIHHRECWDLNDGCAKYGCPSRDAVRPGASERSPAAAPAVHSLGFCPYCQMPIAADWELVRCPRCNTPYHAQCWKDNGGCAVYGCAMMAISGADAPGQPMAVAQAIHKVGTCPYCQTAIAAGSDYLTCPQCKTPHHSDCWQENSGCAVYGCIMRINP